MLSVCMYAGIAFSIALRYPNACSQTLTTKQNVADTNAPSEAVSKRAYTSGVCTSVHMQHVSKSAHVCCEVATCSNLKPSSGEKLLICPIY